MSVMTPFPKLIILCCLSLTSFARAQQTVTVVDSGFAVFTSDLTRGQVRLHAQEDLFKKAVVRATGISIESITFGSKEEHDGKYREMFTEVNQTKSYGRIVDCRIMREGIVKEQFGVDVVEGYRIVATCDVSVDQEDPDPAFQLALKLNKDVYYGSDTPRGSDEVIVTLESTLDAYLTLFGVAGDSVTVLLPNKQEPGSFLPAGESLEFPSKRLRENYGLRYRATLPSGESRASEMVFAIATLDSIPFKEGSVFGGPYGVPTYHSGLMDLYRWLSEIKPSRRTEAHRIFEIRRAERRGGGVQR